MLALFPFIVIGLIVGGFMLLNLTDKLGWTSVYKKRDASASILGGVLLGSEQLLAPEDRRAAIEYRLQKKEQIQQQNAGQDRDPGERPPI